MYAVWKNRLLSSVIKVSPTIPSENFTHLTVTIKIDQTGGIHQLITLFIFFPLTVYSVRSKLVFQIVFFFSWWLWRWNNKSKNEFIRSTKFLILGRSPDQHKNNALFRSRIGSLDPPQLILQVSVNFRWTCILFRFRLISQSMKTFP